MIELPTPETDAAWSCFKGYMEPLQDVKDLSRKLERERDEWAAMCGRYKQERDEVKEKYRWAVIHWQIGSAKMERERDEAREAMREAWLAMDETDGTDRMINWQNKYAYILEETK
jgi:hypothetical protein